MTSGCRFSLTGDADRDLDDCCAWLVAHADVDTANRFLDRADGAFRMLARNPEVGRVRRFQRKRLGTIRSWRIPGFPSWLVFYRVTRKDVLVLRVLHGSRDLESLFEA